MIRLGEASTVLAKMYNTKHPPKHAQLLDSREITLYEMQSKTVNYYNLWPHTMDKLDMWAEDHGIDYPTLNAAMYTWSIANHFKDCVIVALYIYWKEPEIRTMFKLSW